MTHTLDGLRAALTAVDDAAAGTATQSAFKTYALTYAGVPKSVRGADTTVEFLDPVDLAKALEASGQLDASASDSKRRGRLRTSFA